VVRRAVTGVIGVTANDQERIDNGEAGTGLIAVSVNGRVINGDRRAVRSTFWRSENVVAVVINFQCPFTNAQLNSVRGVVGVKGVGVGSEFNRNESWITPSVSTREAIRQYVAAGWRSDYCRLQHV